MDKQKFYITTAITYASRKPHIGNTYEVILTDAIARYKRMRGYDVFFLTGTDEHGQKIENLAKEAGIGPKEYVDGVSGEIKNIWDLMNTTYDHFIRTTDDYHEEAVKKIFQKLYDKGDIYKGEYEGWYCEPCESFFTETQAADGKCPDCGRPVQRMKEEAYFFRMSAYQERLLKYIEDHPDFIEPVARKKEIVNNFLKAGLQDLCVSRTSFKWGIEVPFDKRHVIYVWIDALSNYITALGYGVDKNGDLYEKYWPADVHIIGKDIMRFHAIYWPIILMALEIPLPKKIFGHPWLNFGTDKMSKSKGNVIYADDLAELFGVDGVRYYVLSAMPYSSDGSITYEDIITKYNTDLANNLGNLVSRTHAMTVKYFGGKVPEPGKDEGPDAALKEFSADTYENMCTAMDEYRISDALGSVFEMLGRANKYIDETTPWILAKSESTHERLGTVIYNLLEVIRLGAVMLEPFLPATSAAILEQLGTDVKDVSFGGLVSGIQIGEAKILFARIDEEKMLAEINAKKAIPVQNDVSTERPQELPQIGIEEFMKTELRVAKVIACETVPKAKKLLKLELDLGYEKRSVVSGIAKFYAPDDLIGKKVILVSNLKPAVICGIESQGMILAGGDENVKVVFPDESLPLGTRIR